MSALFGQNFFTHSNVRGLTPSLDADGRDDEGGDLDRADSVLDTADPFHSCH